MGIRLSDRGRATVAAGVTLVVAGLLLGFQDLTRIGIVAVAAVLLALLLVALTPPRVEVETPDDAEPLYAGQAAALATVVRPRGRRSPDMRLEQPLPAELGGGSARLAVPPLRRGRKFTLDLTLTFMSRGRHEVPPVHLDRDDPFGFAHRREILGTRRSLTVLPRVHDLAPPDAGTSSLRGEGAARTLSVLPGEEWGSIRAYRAGDDLRRIHWPVTAHRGQLMMRHDERASTRHALLVLDPHLADRSHRGVLEWGIEMIASAAVALDRADMSFDLLTGTKTLVRADGNGRDEALLALALTPTTARPPRLGLTVEDPFTEAARDQASRAGLVVLAAGTSDAGATGDLLRALPPGTTGLAFLVAAQPDDATRATLLDLAAEAGWSPVACTPDTPHAEAWGEAFSARATR